MNLKNKYADRRITEHAWNIIVAVCNHKGVILEDMMEGDRGSDCVSARREVVRRLRLVLNPEEEHIYSFERIGQFLGRHHATIRKLILPKKRK